MSVSALAAAVQKNSDISDARFAGIYSLCTMVLKLRSLYKWEHGLAPWQTPASQAVLAWIADKELLWDEIRDQAYAPLPVDRDLIDPFTAAPVNAVLARLRLLYGAGYGRSMKPVFFLAEEETALTVQGCPVRILGRELAREMAAPLALSQDGAVYVRRQALAGFLWDQIQEVRGCGRPAMRFALAGYRLLTPAGTVDSQQLAARLDELVTSELPLFIHHEIGEVLEEALPSELATGVAAAYPDSALELVTRALKDVLADTHPAGPLAFIQAERRSSSLGFFIAFLDGIRRLLMPELPAAFTELATHGDWAAWSGAVAAARDLNLRRADALARLWAKTAGLPAERRRQALEAGLLAPLGLAGGRP
ncbi:MAG: Sfum_1244 family protein [Thermodesulfobacteriota bacterium]